MPSHPSRSAMRARMLSEFSPIPAVKTKASTPCKAAASIPAFSADAVDEIIDREGRARLRARLQLPHVVADAGQPLQAAIAVEEILHLGGDMPFSK